MSIFSAGFHCLFQEYFFRILGEERKVSRLQSFICYIVHILSCKSCHDFLIYSLIVTRYSVQPASRYGFKGRLRPQLDDFLSRVRLCLIYRTALMAHSTRIQPPHSGARIYVDSTANTSPLLLREGTAPVRIPVLSSRA